MIATMQTLRKRGTIIALLALLVVSTAVLIVVAPWEESMTPQQATDRVAEVVDSTLAHAAPELTPVPGSTDGNPRTCYDKLGGVADAHFRTYDRRINGFDPALGDQIIERTNQFWLDRGMHLRHDSEGEAVSVIYGSTEGFDYQLIVNRNEQTAGLIGHTPCFSENEWAKAGIP